MQLAETDCNCTHFLWLSDPSNPESEFAMFKFRVVLFGSVSSPFMLHVAIHCHLTAEHSSVAKDILANLYMGNVFSRSTTEACTVQCYKEARSVMSKAKANFNLRSWASNSLNLRAAAQQDKVADKETVVNVLGLMWDTLQDTLRPAGKSYPTLQSTKPTKREILQDLSKPLIP